MKTSASKQKLRERILRKLKAQEASERARRSLKIQKKLWQHPAFQRAQCIFFYVSMPLEVNTHRMIEKALDLGKRVAVPRADVPSKQLHFFEIKDLRSDVLPGAFGILEPFGSEKLKVLPKKGDCILVPGVVFDRSKQRIGHGAGFYDRFLAGLGPKIYKMGLAFTFQVLEETLPQEKHDVVLDELITD